MLGAKFEKNWKLRKAPKNYGRLPQIEGNYRKIEGTVWEVIIYFIEGICTIIIKVSIGHEFLKTNDSF